MPETDWKEIAEAWERQCNFGREQSQRLLDELTDLTHHLCDFKDAMWALSRAWRDAATDTVAQAMDTERKAAAVERALELHARAHELDRAVLAMAEKYPPEKEPT